MKPTRLAVLGHRGMLGHLAVQYFERAGHQVLTVNERFDITQPKKYFDALVSQRPEVVINALGAIKQKTSDYGQLLAVNGAFPVLLRLALPADAMLVHPSTDCVFAGTKGNYGTDHPLDADDIYGLSKGLGEAVARYQNTVVLRASMIGPEPAGSKSGLLGWFLSNADGSTVKGFTNHLWNGVTTLEWCRVVERVVTDGARGVVQVGTINVASKAALLEMFNRAYKRDIRIEQAQTPVGVDRTLAPTLVCKPIEAQIEELAAWCPAQISG